MDIICHFVPYYFCKAKMFIYNIPIKFNGTFNFNKVTYRKNEFFAATVKKIRHPQNEGTAVKFYKFHFLTRTMF